MDVNAPMHPVDTEKLAQTLKAAHAAAPVTDRRTVEDMRIELRGLQDRLAFHEEKIGDATEKLKELQQRFAAKTDALNVAKDMVATRPALRGDIKALERAIEGLTEEISDTEKYRTRHSNIAADLEKKIKAFDHKRLKELERQEKVLSAAGL